MGHSEVKHLPKVDHTPADLDAVSRLLLATAAHIEKHGLSCGGPIDGLGRQCVLVTMSFLGRDTFGIVDAAIKRLRPHVPAHYVPGWSDSTPPDQVIAKLRAVALGG